ncbi:MAG: murein biosynthesis integral membrane protein MurJ [Deltaproteobacteria bacterium]|nr:murein biosynthesis integral membrane protein MurJ [Deltaproteobacteria bacterium]
MSSPNPSLRKSVAALGAANLLSRVSGLAREVVFAAVFGAGLAADAWNAAFRIGNLMRELFAEGALSNAFVPLYADVEEKDGRDAAFALANAFLGVLLAAVAAVALLTFAFADPLVSLIAGGFEANVEKAALTASLSRALSPFVGLIAMASVFMGMLNVRGRFFWPAVSPLLMNGAVIAACLAAPAYERLTGHPAIFAVAWASLLGGAAQALAQLPLLWRQGFRLRPTLAGHPALRRLWAFVLPAVIAISVTQLHLLVETQLASRLGDGPVSWLLYAFRIAHLPFSIISGAVGVAALAGLSVHAARGDHAAFRRDLSGALNLNSTFMLPAAVGLYLLADPLVALFFERGAFTAQDTAATATILRGYAVAIWAIGAQRVLVPVFYTLNDPRTPMWIGLGLVLVKFPLAAWLTARLGVIGIPLSHAILATVEVFWLTALLHRRAGGLWSALIKPHAKALIATVGMGLAVSAMRPYAGDGLLSILVLGGGGAGLFFVLGAALGLEESRALVRRVLRRQPPGLPPTISPESQAALTALTDGVHGLTLTDGVATLSTAAGLVRVTAQGGALSALLIPQASSDQAKQPTAVDVVLRPTPQGPIWIGLRLPERALRAEVDQVTHGDVEGVVLAVPSAAGG